MSTEEPRSKKRKLSDDIEYSENFDQAELLKTIAAKAKEIASLKDEIGDLKAQAMEYESAIVIEKAVQDFKKEVLEDQTIALFTLPDSEEEHELKLAKRYHDKLEPFQQSSFSYLKSKRIEKPDCIPKRHVLEGLTELALIRILLTLVFQMKELLYEDFDCVGQNGSTYRKAVSFLDQHGKSRKMVSSRLICGFVYGFDALVG